MDEITKKVEKMYIEFPYPPDHARDRFWKKRNKKTFTRGCALAQWLLGVEPSLEGAKHLDAGSGTGIRVIGYAGTIPGIRCTGLELSPESRKHAIDNAEAMGADNIEFVQGNILDEDLASKLDPPYDLLTSHGVIHHLSDPEKGLRNLLTMLKPGGIAMIGLYGAYGRHEPDIVRRAVSLLEPDTDNYDRRLTIVRELISKDKLFGKKLKTKFQDDAYIMDAYLHVQERSYTLDEMLEMFGRCGLEVLSWYEGIQAEKRLSELLPETLLDDARALDRLDLWRLIEIRERPYMIMLAGRKK
jgi:SAM-dependent methyltransferase